MERSGVRGRGGVQGWCVAAAFLVAFVVAAPSGWANIAAARADPARMATPLTAAPTPLEVAGEVLRFECEEATLGPQCTFEATYRIVNPTTEEQHVVAAFYGIETTWVDVEIDGALAERELTPEEVTALDEAIIRVDAPGFFSYITPWPLASVDHVTRAGFDLKVAPGATRQVVARGGVAPGRFFNPSGYAVDLPLARHPVVGYYEPDRRYDLAYLLGPLRTWAKVGPIELEVTTPADWEVTGWLSEAFKAERYDTLTLKQTPGPADAITRRVKLDGAATAMWLGLGFGLAQPALTLGGPSVALGGAWGAQGGFRLRAGWQVGIPDYLVLGVAGETNFGDLVTVVPGIEIGTPTVLFIPSLSAGLALPVRVLPEVAVGVRAQAGLHLYSVGALFAFDWYPGQDEGDATQLMLLGEIGL